MNEIKKIVAFKGEVITCPNDHPIAEIVEDLFVGQLLWTECFGNFVPWMEKPLTGTHIDDIPRCPCGQPWIRMSPVWNGNPCLQIHFRDGGWWA